MILLGVHRLKLAGGRALMALERKLKLLAERIPPNTRRPPAGSAMAASTATTDPPPKRKDVFNSPQPVTWI